MKKYNTPKAKIFEIEPENIAGNPVMYSYITLNEDIIDYTQEDEDTEYAATTYRTTLWGND